MAGKIPAVVATPAAGAGSIQVVSTVSAGQSAAGADGQAMSFKDALSQGVADLKLAGLGQLALAAGDKNAGQGRKISDSEGQVLDPAADAAALAGAAALQAVPLLQQQIVPNSGQAGSAMASSDGKSIAALSLASSTTLSGSGAGVKALDKDALSVAAGAIAADGKLADGQGAVAAKFAVLHDGAQAILPANPADQAAAQGVSMHAGAVGVSGNSAALQSPAQVNLPVAQIPQHVQAQGWDAALGQRVIWMAGQQHQVAQLQLNPPNLGPLEVQLNIHKGEASAVFLSAHAPVREAIENALPKLREMLADSGINLANVNVSSQDPRRDPSAFSGGQFASGYSRGESADDADQTASVAPTSMRRSWSNGMVDTFV